MPADRVASLGGYKGQPVTVGIRPEDLRVGAPSESADMSFDALVEVVEPLGAEILLDTSVGGQQVVARVDPTVRARPHEKLRLTFVPERIHFFDATTEAVVK